MPRRILQGKVVGTESNKTVVVYVERFFKHPLYKKYIKKSKRYHAHDENNISKLGESIKIQECPPKSKLKKWEIIKRYMKEM